MDKDEIKKYLGDLNSELKQAGTKGEVCVYGGAVMCLVYDARPSTKDVDAIFKPAQQIRKAIQKIAEKNKLKPDWMNDADKGDVEFLIRKLDLKEPHEVFEVLEKYYPRRQIKPATKFFIEEIFGK